jgi:hypothetical protein
MTLWEFHLRMEGYNRKRDESWHKVRVLASLLLQPHLKKGKKIRPEDILSLPMDKKPKPTKEQFEKFMGEL